MSLKLVEAPPQSSPGWCSIFNTVEFFRLHETTGALFVSFLSDDALIGVCHFTPVAPGVYRSPRRGTFGGIDFAYDTDLGTKHECVALLDQLLKAKGAREAVITAPPWAHDLHGASSLFNALWSAGFRISNQELNHAVTVDPALLVDKMARNNKKRLKKCEREGFRFERLTSVEGYRDAYAVIAANRQAKGFPLSMTFDEIMSMVEAFPERLYFFRTAASGATVASSVCIKLNEAVLYVFYWGDLPGYEQFSPVVHLADGIYAFAQSNGFKLLDAGTSSLNGAPNFGVAAFKENLGFTASLKATYAKSYG